ncbi:acyl-CoA dehydrogenase family protein [Gulosibacter sp. ACHW.36C]|uniref:Acyl-CoA dehydrogenase family protein n=1 Tax=Gulosibacter sediminis TaxID=1729695 RepID=A0ABY4MYB5_9MICO|nr:acyl-CoA dehydrogenase [Gulosibacter sediminis]UQN15019.1 acyl-CoA dehydrogenase family protein [Gulosibacter sediminis]
MTDQHLEDLDHDLEVATGTSGIDREAIFTAIMGSWPEQRALGRKVAATPDFWRDDSLSMAEHRERVLEQSHKLVAFGTPKLAFPESVGGGNNHGGNLAAFEQLALADPSLQIKTGVQFGLFGSAIMHLGTEVHHKRWLPDVIEMRIPGAFAMTESGHGSNVAGLDTTATYDEATQEWVINTPFRNAWKDYLGNAAKHGIAAVVFAQLITKGVNHGVHAFYVPIRDDAGEFLPGVGGDDDAEKGGLNGIDNGRLHFDHVRIPRDYLLNRYGNVDEEGNYTSPIESPGRRFFVMTGTLVQGRVSLDGASAVAQQASLQIAVTYANQRRQFDNTKSGRETVLLDYGRHQRRLIPRIATAFAATFAHDELLREFDAVFSGKGDTPERRADLETLAAALKPLSTWQAMDTMQDAREACGGAGFLMENRIVGLHHDFDVYTTFEGDNTVLHQLVGKRLLDDYASKFKGVDARGQARIVATQFAGKAFREIGLARLGGVVGDLGQSARSVGWLREPENQRALLEARVEEVIAEIGMEIGKVAKASADEQNAVFNANQNKLIDAARAYAELTQWDAFTRKLAVFEEGSETQRVMTWLRDLFGLSLIERDLQWYLLAGRLTAKRARLVTSYIDRLVLRLRPLAQDLVSSFGYTDAQLRAKIIEDDREEKRQEEANAYYEQLRAAGEEPKDERDIYRMKRGSRR